MYDLFLLPKKFILAQNPWYEIASSYCNNFDHAFSIFYPIATCITALAFLQSAVVSRAVLKLQSKYK